MSQAPTTRMGLLDARARLALSKKGAQLLRSKRQVLADEFFRLMRHVVAGRQRLDDCLRGAARSLTLARSVQDGDALDSLSLVARREIPLEVRRRSVWGVFTPEVVAPRLVRAPDARGSSPLSWSASAMDAAKRFEESMEVLLGISSRELHLRRLGEEIQATSSRINALEQRMMPRLAQEASRIDQVLEERAREDAVRLKRFRQRRRRSG